VPNSNSPDPNFGKCMQCVAIDRARYKLKPPLERSSVCTQCFQQYCFDRNNLPSISELPGRKLEFVDPDPQGVSAVSGFLSRSKVALILGFLALLLIVAGLSAFLCVHFRHLYMSELIPVSYVLLFFLLEYGENVGRVGLSITR
jgi:lysophospholipase